MKACPTCKSTYPQGFAVCPQDGTPLQELGAWSEGTVIKGKYRILAKIGEGGMGAVYKALHLRFNELRAVKVISAQLASDPIFVSRFEKEAILTRRLQHPNAVRVDDIDEAEDGRPFIVMEFMDGQSLKEPIRALGALPVPRACSIVKQVASALDAAHRLGIIHRDIKPENIILIVKPSPSADGALQETAKVLDFGIAKIKEAGAGQIGVTLTETGALIGSPPYMSPEQAMGLKGDQLDGRSDLYSLGVVMYQMLTGALPIKADTTMSMLMAHIQNPPVPIRKTRPDLLIPDPIANLVMRMLEKKPESRPQTAQAVIDEIESAETGFTGLPGDTVVAPTIAATLQERPAIDLTRKMHTEEFAVPAKMPPIQVPPPREVEAQPVMPVKTGPQYSGAIVPPPPQKSFLGRHAVLLSVIILVLVILSWRIYTRQAKTNQSPPASTSAPSTAVTSPRQESYEESHSRGHQLMKQGDYSGAVIEFEQAVRSRPDDDELRMDLGKALEANGQKQKAYEEFEVVCTRNPDLPECLNDYQKLKKELKETAPSP